MSSIETSDTTSRSLTPAKEFEIQSNDFLQKWKDATLVIPNTEPNAIDTYSRHLSMLYLIPLEASYLISSAVINAAVGASIKLKGPGANTTVASLNTMLLSENSSRIRLAIEDAFEAIRPYADRMAVTGQTITEESSNEVRKQGANLLKQAEDLQAKAEKVRSPNNPNLKPSDTPGFDQKWLKETFGTETQEEKNEKEATLLNQKSAGLRKDATKLLSGFHFHKRPGFLVEGVLPEELIASHELCADGSIFNLDTDANTWTSVARLSPAKCRETGSRLAAGWRASTVARKGEILPASTISSIARMSKADFPGFWTNRRIEENRLRSIILPVNTEFAGSRIAPTTNGQEPVRPFFERVLNIFFGRIEGKQQEDVTLSKEAQVIYLGFVSEVESVQTCAPAISDIVQSASSTALRLSLLIHLGQGAPGFLSPETMKRACHIAAWCVCGTTQLLLSNLEESVVGEDDLDDEIWVMVGKVRTKGPLSRRELYRTFHDQSSSRHIPVLEKALSRGLLRENEDGSLSVPGPAPIE